MLNKSGLPIFTAVAFALSTLAQPQNELSTMGDFDNNSTVANVMTTNNLAWSMAVADPNTLQPRTDHGHYPVRMGIVSLIKNGKAWTGFITVGTPPQTLEVIFDTGTPSSWFASALGAIPEPPHTYHPHKAVSSTSTFLKESFSGSYSSRGVKGMWHSDVVDVGGILTKMQFGCATKRGVYRSHFDGVIGMAAFVSPRYAHKTFFSSVLEQYSNLPKTFAFYLGKRKSEFRLGVTMQSIAHMQSFPIISVMQDSGLAGLEKADIFVDDESLFDSSPGNIKTVFNSGSLSLSGPPDHVRKLYKKLGGTELPDKSYSIPCDSKHLVSFSWGDGGTKWKFNHIYKDEGICRGVIRPNRHVRESLWILGLHFMLGKHIVYDYGNKEIRMEEVA